MKPNTELKIDLFRERKEQKKILDDFFGDIDNNKIERGIKYDLGRSY